ncbi:MAG: energy transducer TonB [Spartobacteria bacterium]
MIKFIFPVLALFLASATPPLLAATAHSTKPKVIVSLNDNQGLTFTPVPAYPAKAAEQGWGGVGLYQLRFASNGAVSSVTGLISIDHRLLDDSAEASLAMWRCQPGALRTANITITFRANKTHEAVVVDPPGEDEKSGDLIAASTPPYPNEARRRHWNGSGVFMLHFRPDGSVDKVFPARSIGNDAIDAECALSLSKWRCRPGAYDVVLVPITLSWPGHLRRR